MKHHDDILGPACSSCEYPTVLVGSLPQSGLHPAMDVFLCETCRELVTEPPLDSTGATTPSVRDLVS